LRESRTGSDRERKNDCRDDSRFRHHIFSPHYVECRRYESSPWLNLSGLRFEQ
jgi:hypothetical protein